MSDVRIELNWPGLREILRSDEMKQVCKEHADKAVAKLGPGYASDDFTGKNRVNASIRPVTSKAWEEALENNTILKALR